MLTNDKPNPQPEQRQGVSCDFHTLQELGDHACRLAALLRAAVNAECRDDEAWLVSMALDEARAAEALYSKWGKVSAGERN